MEKNIWDVHLSDGWKRNTQHNSWDQLALGKRTVQTKVMHTYIYIYICIYIYIHIILHIILRLYVIYIYIPIHYIIPTDLVEYNWEP